MQSSFQGLFHSLLFRKLQKIVECKALLERIEVRHLPKEEVKNASKICQRSGHVAQANEREFRCWNAGSPIFEPADEGKGVKPPLTPEASPLKARKLTEKSGNQIFFDVLKILCEDENVDAIVSRIFIPSLLALDFHLRWLKRSKPIFFILKEDIEILREIKLKIERFFPVYTTPERAVKTLKNALTFTKNPQLSLLFKRGSE